MIGKLFAAAVIAAAMAVPRMSGAQLRTSALEIGTGTAATAGGTRVSDVDVVLTVPLSAHVQLLSRAGALSASDPTSGVVLDSLSASSSRTSVASLGAVWHPSASLWITPRIERWTTLGLGQTFAWIDGSWRIAQNVTLLVGSRALSGQVGAGQVGAGADVAIAPGHVLTLYGLQGVRASSFEARRQLRAAWYGALGPRYTARLAAIRDVDTRLAATTTAASLTTMVTSFTGVRTEATWRAGAYARRSVRGILVLRW